MIYYIISCLILAYCNNALTRAVTLLPFDPVDDTDTGVREDFGFEVNLGPDVFRFFEEDYTTVYISDNGAMTFTSSFVGGESATFVGNEIWVAPFGDDVGEGFGNIYFRKETTGTNLQTATTYVRQIYPQYSAFDASWILRVTWSGVRAFPGSSTEANTFQAVLVTDGSLSFALFLYESLQWGTGTVGVSAGDGSTLYTLCGSGTSSMTGLVSAAQTTCGETGLFGFRVDTKGLQSAGCTSLVTTGACSISDQMKARKLLRCQTSSP